MLDHVTERISRIYKSFLCLQGEMRLREIYPDEGSADFYEECNLSLGYFCRLLKDASENKAFIIKDKNKRSACLIMLALLFDEEIKMLEKNIDLLNECVTRTPIS
jgi:hypothetical protein